MIEKIIVKIRTLNPWAIVVACVVVSEVLTLLVVSTVELALKGEVTWDYLFTGAVTALVVSFIVVAIIVFTLGQIREHEKYVVEVSGIIDENRERYRQIFQQSSDYILMLEPASEGPFVITDASDSAYEKLGYTRQELLGKPISTIIGENFRHLIKERTETIQSGKTVKFESEHIRKDRTTLSVEVLVKMMSINGKPYVYATHRDITERKRLENQQQELMARIEIALAEAHRERKKSDEASRLKSEFISNVSHELNTPLTSVLGYSHIANDKDKEISNRLSRIIMLARKLTDSDDAGADTEIAELAEAAMLLTQESIKCNGVVMEQGHKLNVIINDLIDFSRMDSGKGRLESQPVSVYLLMDSLERSQSKPARDKDIRLKCNTADFLKQDIVMMGDGRKLEKILEVLVDNAIKFSNEGEIEVVAEMGDGSVYFSVKDQGLGIDENDKENVFDVFRQLDGSFSRTQGGLGLGLSLARKLVHAMNGTIGFESKVGVGTKFTVTIPYVPAFPEREDGV